MRANPTLNRYREAALIAVCLCAGMVLSVYKGTDASWDLDNYHLYAPYAALNGRLWPDFFAGDFEGYLNPLESIPYFILRFVLLTGQPRLVAALAGLPFGILAIITVRLARVVLADRPPWEALAAAVLGLSGSTLLSEIGTPSGDIPVASLTLLGVLAVIRPTRPGHVTRQWRAPACAGLAIGCAVGVKLTAAIFVPGLFLLACRRAAASRDLPVVAVAYAVGALAGFMVMYGWWGTLLWLRFGDPFFPMLTSLFPTPWLPPGLLVHDLRFYPKTLLEWAFFPFYWLHGGAHVVVDQSIRDPRFAIVFLASAAMIIGRWARRLGPPTRVIAGIYLFFWVSYVVWLLVFSYLRYGSALEAISGILIWTTLAPVLGRRAGQSLLCAILITCIVFTNRYSLGKISFGQSLLASPVPPLPAGSIVFMSGEPIGFMAYEMRGDAISFVGIDRLAGVRPEIQSVSQALSAGRPARLLTARALDSQGLAIIDAELAPVALTVTPASCQAIEVTVKWVAAPLELCQVAGGTGHASGRGAISPSPTGQ